MAGFVASPNTVMVQLRWNFETRPQLNVLHAQYTTAGPLSPGIADSLFTALKADARTTAHLLNLTTLQSLAGVSVLDLRSPNNFPILSTTAAAPGTGTGAPLPPQNSTVITLRTGFTGRSFRGRVYLFGYIINCVDPNGAIVPAVNATAVAFTQAVQAAMAAQAMTLAIRSPAMPARPSKPGGTLPPKDYTITPVTQIQARDTVWDTNRRRLDIFRR